ncbi:MAG: SDR family NAD(P)-dependent oxidoreductase [Thermoanaerobaculia bacterium]
MMRLEGKVSFITGASRGIGAAIAERFAKEGSRVAVAARSAVDCERAASGIRSRGGEALAVPCDVTVRESYAAAVARAVESWGRIDILVNNAGMSGLTPLESDPAAEEKWDAILASSLTSAFRVSRSVLPSMPDGGRILHQSSVLGRFGVPGYAAYASAKHGIIGLTRAMALELAPRAITVNAICPGWVETEMARDGYRRIAEQRSISIEEARAVCARMAPLGRVLEPSEIAGLAVYIASEEARNLTGQAIVLDGGQVMP